MHGIELCSNLSDFILGPCCAFLSGISSILGLQQASNKTRTRYIVEFIDESVAERLSSNLNQLYGQTIFISLGSVDQNKEDLSFLFISFFHEKESQNQASSAVVNWSFELILKWNIISSSSSSGGASSPIGNTDKIISQKAPIRCFKNQPFWK